MKKRRITMKESNVVDFQAYKQSRDNKKPFKKVLLSKDKQIVVLAKDFVLVDLFSEQQEDAIASGDIKLAHKLGAKFFHLASGDEIIPLKESKSSDDKDLLIDAANYPADFNIEYFKNIPSYKERIQYAKEKLGKALGTGSARVVLNADNNTVMKLAKNKKGLAQNRIEHGVSSILTKYSKSSDDILVARVLDFDPDYLWIESEIAKKMSTKDFKNIIGFSFLDFSKVFHNETVDSFKVSVDPAIAREIRNLDFFDTLVGIKEKFSLSTGDLVRISSWGVVTRNGKLQPVLIDYGLNDIVYDTLYRKK
jgi:hypothetical protein